ncbi:MAG: flavodoxin family protein, partial [Nanoarchaeota archaeon]
VGTPIWAGKIAPAVRTFLKQLPRTNGKKAGVFITHLSKDVPESALDELAVLVEKKGYRVVSRENFRMNQKSIVLRRKIQSFAAKLLVD